MDEEDETAAVEDVYDEIAASYAEGYWSDNPHQAELEFPATTDLIPTVSGERVLDAGCGSGVYTEWLLDRGATVVGVDLSEAMLEEARDLVGTRATLRLGDLSEGIPFAEDGEFDGVVCAQVLDHLPSLEAPFQEFARILEEGGFLVISVRHPLRNASEYEDWTYYETERQIEDWGVETPHYTRPLQSILNELVAAGFQLEHVSEPEPTETFREAAPKEYEQLSKRPQFLCLRARKR
ncbi:class I SAM-dependent methyltransferase [Salinarchaeum laminariae]|uniref:class I SAM-dependent methyltransferase n=1 Tax=Salinarchaeum laminariae TaxID=869888 RepID=UPI0020C0E5C6|nr:class I SAM-dependent methyltransferase [Salinarchaeum laminariae]